MAIHGKAFAHCFDCDSPQQPLSSCGCISPTVLCSCKFLISLVDTSKELQGGSRAISPWALSPWHIKSQGPWGQGPEVRGTLGPRPLGPWDLMCQGLKVRGPKVRGPLGQGLMALEPCRVPADRTIQRFESLSSPFRHISVPSKHLPERMQIHTGCIYLSFLHCAFSNVSLKILGP